MSQNPRPTFACARCYKRKKKCDNDYPSCSECARVGAPCVGLDRSSKTEIPRSVVMFLEDLVAQLEATNTEGSARTEWDIESSQPQTSIQPTIDPNGVDYAGIYSLAVETSSKAIPWAMEKPLSSNALPYFRNFFMGAELPFPLAFKSPRSSVLPSRDESLDFSNIPLEVIDRLIAVYTERILPQYPFFPKQYVLDIYDRYRRQQQGDQLLSAQEFFIIYMVMAITSLSSRSKDYNKLIALAESLRRDAIDKLENGMNLGRSSLTNIQLLLLLTHYGFLLPSSANLWHLTGDAMRMATELGLHQELPLQSGLEPTTIAFRRRLFWVLYSMERSVAVTSHRPFSVRDEQIEVYFPVSYDDHDPSYLHSGQFSYVRFVDRLPFHLLQSEICAVNIGNRGIPATGQTYEHWMTDMERRISDANAGVLPDASGTSRWCDFATWQCILLLHMPCVHNPEPNECSLLKCFDAAISISEGYWEMAQSEFVEYPWHAIHNAYEAGILILYILSHFPTPIRLRYTTKRVFEIVHQLSGFFILMTKRWPITHLCGSFFDSLRKGALSTFLEEEFTDPSTDLEMRRLKHVVFRENADLLYCYEESLPVIRLTEDITISQLIDPTDAHHDFSGEMDFLYLFDFSTAPDLDISFVQEPEDLPMVGTAPELLEPSSSPASRPQVQQNSHIDVQRNLAVDRLQLQTALGRLPVCSHCKRRRIKCDMNLPSCRNCAKSGKECAYIDHALSRETTRKYIHELHQQAEDLMKKISLLRERRSPDRDALAIAQTSGSPSGYFGTMTSEKILDAHPKNVFVCFEDDISLKSPRTMFFGPTSVSVHIVLHNPVTSQNPDGKPRFSSPRQKPTDALFESMSTNFTGDPPEEMIEVMTQHYYQSIEICYPILGQELISQTLDNIYRPSPVGNINTHTRARFYLTLAVACALIGQQDRRFRPFSEIYYIRARSAGVLNCLGDSPTILSLQTTLLLCVYTWLCPSSNNIWRLLGHASRVCLDIVEMHGFEKSESANVGVLYRTLYSIETHVAIASGRPRQLPDGKEAFVTGQNPSFSHPEDISILVYELARLQSRFHREMIARRTSTTAADLGFPISSECSWVDSCAREMGIWLEHWDATIDSSGDQFPTWCNLGDLSGPLKCWGRFQQSEGFLLAHSASANKETHFMTEDEIYPAMSRLLDSGRRLYRGCYSEDLHDPSSSTNFAFPMSWTHIHSMIKAFVSLLQHTHVHMGTDRSTLDGLFEDCIAVVIAFEANIDFSLTGLSDCLQHLYRHRPLPQMMQ